MKRTNRPTKGLVNTEELGRAVRRRREELGLSLRDVASETSVSASTLSRIENGTGKPDADNIARLTSWLDVPMERILSGRDPKSEAVAGGCLLSTGTDARNCRSSSARRSKSHSRNGSGAVRIVSRRLHAVQQKWRRQELEEATLDQCV